MAFHKFDDEPKYGRQEGLPHPLRATLSHEGEGVNMWF